MTPQEKKALLAAGKLSRAARNITGGYELEGFRTSPVTIGDLSARVQELRVAVDEYDAEIIKLSINGREK